MSYQAAWQWNIDQFNGFKSELSDLSIKYKIFEMNTKQKNTKEWLETKGREARSLIDSWNPDLVYINDDYAQEYVTRYYVNKNMPFVFSGVNTNPFRYGIVGSSNITGIVELEHFIETINLLREIIPEVKKIAVILDNDPTWEGVVGKMIHLAPEIPDLSISQWNVIKTFSQYKEIMKDLHGKVDAVGLLGIFSFKDDNGNNVPFTEVLKWTTENSNLPDFSFWKERVLYGTLCTVSVSAYQQGVSAGKIARAILVDGKQPFEIPIRATARGEPAVSLARARKIGIRIKSSVLLSAEIIPKFQWEP